MAAVVAAADAVTDMYCSNQSRLLLQFHVTGRCNLRCRHCYRREGDVEPLAYSDVISVIEQYKELQKEYNTRHQIRRKGHINITGGEPFIRSDIKEILRYLGENREEFSYGVLSNGSFLDDELVAVLKETQVSFVQLSIDGDRVLHDSLRAPGDYDRVLKTAEYLEKNGIRTYISFTANKENYRCLPQVAKECRKRGITKLWSDRLVPIGNGEDISSLAITDKELPEYVAVMKKARGGWLTRLLYPKTKVTMNRALQFLHSDGSMYSCSAGNSLITVDEFGTVMPCRRMPIPCGSVLDSTLKEIYYNNGIMKGLRDSCEPEECRNCNYVHYCKGGAKCQSYAAYGSYYRADPACPCAERR